MVIFFDLYLREYSSNENFHIESTFLYFRAIKFLARKHFNLYDVSCEIKIKPLIGNLFVLLGQFEIIVESPRPPRVRMSHTRSFQTSLAVLIL